MAVQHLIGWERRWREQLTKTNENNVANCNKKNQEPKIQKVETFVANFIKKKNFGGKNSKNKKKINRRQVSS